LAFFGSIGTALFAPCVGTAPFAPCGGAVPAAPRGFGAAAAFADLGVGTLAIARTGLTGFGLAFCDDVRDAFFVCAARGTDRLVEDARAVDFAEIPVLARVARLTGAGARLRLAGLAIRVLRLPILDLAARGPFCGASNRKTARYCTPKIAAC
jgi:hypothetical protein